jgi:hypothetical protein
MTGETNLGQGQLNAASTQTVMDKCGQRIPATPPHDVAICNGQVVEALDDQGSVAALAMYPKQPFDIAGRTGTIAFDVSNDTHGTHRAWPELWYTDQPVPAPFDHFTSLQSVPRNGFGVRFGNFCPAGEAGCGLRPSCPEQPLNVAVNTVSSAVVVNNFVSNDSDMDGGHNPISVKVTDCVKASSGPGDMNHYELRVSQNQIDVYGTDASTTSPLRHIAVITGMGLTLTRGLIWMEDVHYNGNKDGPDQGNHTFSWDNLAFDGPRLPRDLTFDAPDRLQSIGGSEVNLGWPVPTSDAPLSLTVSGVHNSDTAAKALVLFSYYTDDPVTLTYRLNDGAWHDQPWPYPRGVTSDANGVTYCCGVRTLAVPVALSDVVPGANRVQFKSSGGAAIFNIDLLLVGAAG